MTMIETEISIDVAADMLRYLTDAGDPVMIWGAPGIGKSQIVHQLGEETKRKVIEFRTNIREPVDVRGIPVPDHNTGRTRWFVPDELPQVERDGATGILFIDEINTASMQMQAVMFGLVLERRVGEYELPEGWVIVAAGNRVGDRAAAQRMPTALRNRFAHLFVKPDVEAWVKWATRTGVEPELVAFIKLRGKDVLHIMPKGDENAFPTPRSLTRCGKHVSAPEAVRMRLFASHVGDAVAAELDGFIQLYRSLGSLSDIVADPDNFPVPDVKQASIRYAVSTGLARLSDRKNFDKVMRYAKRLNRESEVLIVHDATLRDPSLKNTKVFTDWAVRNQDITMH